MTGNGLRARFVGITGTEHAADGPVAACNVQGPPGLKVTVPVGTVAEVVEVSETVAVQVDDWPTTMLDGLQDMFVVVGCVTTCTVTFTVAVLLLPEWAPSGT